MSATSPFRLGVNTLSMWRAHQTMRDESTNLAVKELGEIAEAYTIALEVVATLATKGIEEFSKRSNPESSRREAVLTGYIVGLTLVEHAILSGYSAQAAALVRQELEAIAALEELRIGKRRDGKTPNIRDVPNVPGTVYGDLSKAAHFSDTSALRILTSYRGEVPDAPGPSEVWILSPQHVPKTTRQLFALHALLLLHFAEHQAAHCLDQDVSEITEQVLSDIESAVELLKNAGVV